MKIVVRDKGSLKVEVAAGEALEIVDGEGRPFGLGGRTVVSLCRCGQSESKPFCDGSHNRCGFDSVVVARDLPPPAAR
ncbi:MAG: CDGSH iron-sulfur domain-containing protein [Thermoanaerobaculia bacterium]|jgi:CDGSH-type Zn-finger protein|nr:MAG: CDGSH iron-sulfur domain-containing protein [Thermoanaerobaculia bacterium]MBZ0102492.1 CDGSH iron-sulfur domain-containing protein [Thermoanaerobaculia bacterium]